MNYGDVSIVSFHATKVFQSVEGGAVVTNNNKIAEKARCMRNFGFKTPTSFYGIGINAKMSEFHAAMGLCSLKMIPRILAKYTKLVKVYNEALGDSNKDYLTYYPIFYESEQALLKAIKFFNKNDIYPRRYFYPPLNKVLGGKRCPTAEWIMERVLCLPLYYELTNKQQKFIIDVTKKTK